MKKLIYILLFFSSTYYSQAPGYLGKRFSIEADINLLPSFSDFIIGNKIRYVIKDNEFESIYSEDYSAIKMNFNKSLVINYSIGRRVDLSLRLNHTNLNMIFNNFRDYSADFLSSEEPRISYNAMEYGLNFKIYRNNFIAPVGKHISFGVGYCIASPKKSETKVQYLLENDNYEYGTENIPISGVIKSKEKPNFVVINIGIGDKKVNKQNLYIHYALEYKYYYTSNKNIDTDYYNNIQDYVNKAIYRNVKKNLAYDNLFNLKLGVGIII